MLAWLDVYTLGIIPNSPLLNPKCPSYPNVPREYMDTWQVVSYLEGGVSKMEIYQGYPPYVSL